MRVGFLAKLARCDAGGVAGVVAVVVLDGQVDGDDLNCSLGGLGEHESSEVSGRVASSKNTTRFLIPSIASTDLEAHRP